jgi:hypothetical protein
VRPPVAIARQQIGPEYVALIDGVQDIAENDQFGAEFLSAFGVLPGCVRSKSRKSEGTGSYPRD